MAHTQAYKVLKKLHTLRRVFEKGQQAIPFLEELFRFIEEIAPLLDEIDDSMRASVQATSQLKSVSEATELATTEILDLVDEVQNDLRALEEHVEPTETTQALLEGMRRKSNKIMLSLQVQDITSQQISAVAHLIDSIRRHMGQMIDRLDAVPSERQVQTLDQLLADTDGTFDDGARYDHSSGRQKAADDVVTSYREPVKGTQQAASQEEIDQLFN